MLKHLEKDIKKHGGGYFILLAGLLIGAFLFFWLSGLLFWRVILVVCLGIFYFLWGNIHHIKNKDWHVKIALEYFLIALIGCLLLLSIILRS